MSRQPRFSEAVRRDWHELSQHERDAIVSFLHRERSGRSVNELDEEQLTRGDRIADEVTSKLGSWRFIIAQSFVLLAWLILNVIGWFHHWDPYPFILLNLALSFQAAYSAPIIMMSQNRQAAKDRLAAANDYQVNLRAEMDVAAIHSRLDELAGAQWTTLLRLQQEQIEILTRIENLTSDVHRISVQSEA